MADQTYEAGVRLTADTSQIKGATAELIRTMQGLQGSVEKVSTAITRKYEPAAKHAAENTDRLRGASEKLKGSLGQAQGFVNRITGSFLAMTAGALGVGVGIGALARSVVEGNIELERMQKQVAGTLFAFRDWRTGVDAVTAVRASLRDARNEFLPAIEEAEEAYAVPATSLATALQTLMGPMQDLGVAEERILKTSMATGAALQVFGTSAEAAGSAIARIVQTRTIPLRSTDPFIAFLRQTVEGMGNLKKHRPEEILKRIEEGMKRLDPAAKEMSAGFEGTMFRLRDFVSDTIRDVGGPAFKYISDQIKVWKERLSATNAEGKTLAQVYAKDVLEAVKKIGEVAGFLLDHWKEIALVIGGIKLAGLIGEIASMTKGLWGAVTAARALMAAQGIGGAAGAAGRAGAGALGGRLAMAGPAGVAVAGIAAGAYIYKEVEAQKKASRELMGGEQATEAFKNMFWAVRGRNPGETSDSRAERKASAEKMLRNMSALGMIDEKGDILGGTGSLGYHLKFAEHDSSLMGKYAQALGTRSQRPDTYGMAGGSEVAEAFGQKFRQLKSDFPELWAGLGRPAPSEEDTIPPTADLVKPGKRKIEQHFHGPINIKQEFRDADPDNVYVQLREGLEENGERRLQSALTDTYGG